MTSITPRQALLLSLAAALSTIAMKTGAWWLTGSVGLLSDALESLVNLAGASFALLMVTLCATMPVASHALARAAARKATTQSTKQGA